MTITLDTLNLDQLVADVRKHAEREPDGIAQCKYFYPGSTPCCIVGHAMFDQGLTRSALSATAAGGPQNEKGIDSLIGCSIDDAPKVQWLTLVQGHQDSGNSWGEAVAYADAEATA